MTTEKFSLEMIDQSMQGYKVGAIVTATIVSKSADGIIVNIGGKNDGLITGDEVSEFSNLTKGTKLDVMIMSSKAIEGCINVSAKKAIDIVEKNVQIPNIKKGARFEAVVDTSNNAGLHCFFGSYKVFVPAGEIEEYYVRDLNRYKGKKLELVATDFDEQKRQIIASRKAILAKDRMESEELFWHAIFVNKIVIGTVQHLTAFGAFVNVDGVDCLVHNSEISFDKKTKPEDVLTAGKQYQFRVISVDRDARKVQLSYKQLQKHPFDEKSESINIGDVVDVEITKILPFGAIAKLKNGLEGLIHISEVTSKTFVKNVYEVCKVGEHKKALIRDIDLEKKKLSLSLKALEDE